MLIKESAKVKKGDILKLPVLNAISGNEELQSVIVDIVSPHNVTCKTQKGANVNYNNVDLVRMGVYSRSDVEGNIFPKSKEQVDEMISKTINRILDL